MFEVMVLHEHTCQCQSQLVHLSDTERNMIKTNYKWQPTEAIAALASRTHGTARAQSQGLLDHRYEEIFGT